MPSNNAPELIDVAQGDLSNERLDFAVAYALGSVGHPLPEISDGPFNPSGNWSHGGPLVEKFGVMFQADASDGVMAYLGARGTSGPVGRGSTHLTAAMRCLVASCPNLGATVRVPSALKA